MGFRKHHSEIAEKVPSVFARFVSLNCNLVDEVEKLFDLQLSEEEGVYRIDMASFLKSRPDYRTQPYTVLMEREGEVIEVPYHQAYSASIGRIGFILQSLLEESGQLTEPGFSATWWQSFYQSLRSSFLDDNWGEADKAFLTHPQEDTFLLSIGPIERYHDRMLGTKRYFSALFMYRSEESRHFSTMWSACSEIYRSQSPFMPGSAPLAVPSLFLGDVIAESGEITKLHSEAWSRPEDPALAQSVGSIKMLMMNTFQDKLLSLKRSAFGTLEYYDIDTEVKTALKERFGELCAVNLILHEMGHTFLKPPQGSTALERYYTLFEEPRAEINALYFASILESRGFLSRGTTKLLFLMDISLLLYKWKRYRSSGLREEYLFSSTFWILAAERHGVLERRSGSWDFRMETLEKVLDLIIHETFAFFNATVRFGHRDNPEVRLYHSLMEKETHALVRSLIPDLENADQR